jgi:histidyl-tRNA synthetase
MFGLPDVSGVGISFGVDRIYDVMEELNLFPEATQISTQVLITNFDNQSETYALPILQQLRTAGIASELYPEQAKLNKQMSYADKKNIPYVLLIGSEEIASGQLKFKNMRTGEQESLQLPEIITKLAV